jgi:leucyl-tRNA synthetase
MNGFNVLHPMGWDAFGLPAERAAVREGRHPSEITQENIANFKRQIDSIGLSYDWDRAVDTSQPEYYRWTQWIFLKMLENDLAYLAEVPVNWCEAQGTDEAKTAMNDWLEEQGAGQREVTYKLRDWLFSRQRYWGEPFPVLHGSDGAIMAANDSLSEEELTHLVEENPETEPYIHAGAVKRVIYVPGKMVNYIIN